MGFWPSLIMDEAKPNVMSFKKDRNLEFHVQIDKAYIVEHRPPSNLKEFCEVNTTFYDIVRNVLHLQALKRIGMRLHFFRVFKTQEEASDALISTGMIQAPGGKHFNVDGPIKPSGYIFRMQDRDIGVHVKIDAVERKVEFIPPSNTPELEPQKIVEFGIMCDIDYYTRGLTLVNQFKPKDWIEHTHHLIKRDSKVFLGGT